jgi:hypothetical protein
VWWALLAAIFFTGRALGGLAGHGLCLIACLAPWTYTPTFESLFAFYVLWIATPLKNLKNRPTYIHLGITLEGGDMILAAPRLRKSGVVKMHLFFRATEVVQDDERIITASLDDQFTAKRLVIQRTNTILPPSLSEMKFETTDGTIKLSLTEFVEPLLLGGQGTIKQAILLALQKAPIYVASEDWTVAVSKGDGSTERAVNFKQETDILLEDLI